MPISRSISNRSAFRVLSIVCLAIGLSACSGGSGPGGGRADDAGTDGGQEPGDGDGDGDGDSDAGPDVACGDGRRDKEREECDDGNVLIGDGCDDRCRVEPGYNCAAAGGPCATRCGDGLIRGSEGCDDRNTVAQDGCDQSCQLEPGWACTTPGEACVAARCGDGLQVGAEACDDQNQQNGDGCNVSCQLEPGWICVGMSCSAAECGDGQRAGAEACDDGNQTSGDGCVEDCSAVEPYHACPPTGGPCLKTTLCGDGIFTADEQCDDGNSDDGDGCHRDCTLEPGWVCPQGTVCDALCGDGLVVGNEQCDDDDGMTCKGGSHDGEACQLAEDCPGGRCGGQSGDGCNENCLLEPGYDCQPGQACTPAICGNNLREGLEECDDTGVGLADQPFDGCYECKREPSCSTGPCSSVCGDGVKLPNEACDDGNTRSGDGCSATCALEPGFACEHVEIDPPNCVDLPLILRDFKKWDSADGLGHPDFDRENGDSGMQLVRNALGYDGNDDGVADLNVPPGTKLGPVYLAPVPPGPDYVPTTHGAAPFNQWYRDSERGKRVHSKLRVCDDGSGTYVFDDPTFYPLDGLGWQDPSVPSADREPSFRDSSADVYDDGSNGCGPPNVGDSDAGEDHNFSFTSEVRFWFTYKGGEELTFRGDDDVWVFIAGKRVIDLGGVHCAQTGTVVLENGHGTVTYSDPDDASQEGVVLLNLQVDHLYEVVVYQAERHQSQSSYRLELGKFFKRLTQCEEVCGDGVRTRGELCDSGSVCVGGTNDGESCTPLGDECDGGVCTSQNDGTYGRCTADCKARGPYCGDAVQASPPEQCDLGAAMNVGAYEMCNPDCTLGPRCGDGNVDGFFGEQCDLGDGNNVGGYGGCAANCRFGPRCGDGVVQAEEGEQCDDQLNRSRYNGCAPGCVWAPRCGDGVLQPAHGEQCDLGEDANVGGYEGCLETCRRAPFCGDGRVDAPDEECDDKNSNDYDGCSASCKQEPVVF